MRYTEQEWNLLVRQGDPDAGHALSGDLAAWRPKGERICARHGLSVAGEMQWKHGGAVRCMNTVFLLGDVAVKLFTRPSPILFPREVESLRRLGDMPEAKTPRLLASGDAISEDDPDHPYLIMKRLPGNPYWKYRDHLSPEAGGTLVAQIAATVSRGVKFGLPDSATCLVCCGRRTASREPADLYAVPGIGGQTSCRGTSELPEIPSASIRCS